MAAVCGINDDFTFHSARHTFATTVTLENGVPIESVSKMLGHTNVKTTQLYARITDTKVSNDMDVLQENLQGVFDKPLTQSVKSRKKVAQAKEIAQLAQQLGVALQLKCFLKKYLRFKEKFVPLCRHLMSNFTERIRHFSLN